ncbi:polysaccharide pyruvyl transferase family protein [Ekhidna sp. MALMAid0563]|uniref:polysaccharide pyruvyl transferase family protein n=1 Tax=Ekhidna sp. MALMAid0563 TaxID=3143937 RepID=UPI0032DFE3D1
MSKILLIGHYGGDNFGDEIMLDSILSVIPSSDNVYVVTKQPDKYGDTLSEKRTTFVSNSLFHILRAFLPSRILILGGGTHFHDDYTKSRYRKHRIYLLKILLISFLMRMKGGKVLYIGVGYGPFLSKEIVFLSKLSVRLANTIVVRDEESKDILDSIYHKKNKVYKGGDVSSMHPHFDVEKRPEKNEAIGISLTSLNYSEGAASDSYWNDTFFPAFISNYRSSSSKVKIFVFRGGDRESDYSLSLKLNNSLREIDESRVQIIPFTYEVGRFVQEMTLCDRFIATRYHSAVLAYLSGADLLIVPYHRKLEGFSRDIHLPNEAILDISEKEMKSDVFKKFYTPAISRDNYILDSKEVYKEIFEEL